MTWKLGGEVARGDELHRWYDAGVGCWLSQDPIGFAAGDANLYRYVGNESTTHVDPSGLARILGSGTLPPPDPGKHWETETVTISVFPFFYCYTRRFQVWDYPAPDHTGRIHDPIPDDVPKEWDEATVDDAIDAVEESVKNREKQLENHPAPPYTPDDLKKYENWQDKRDGHEERLRREREWREKLKRRQHNFRLREAPIPVIIS